MWLYSKSSVFSLPLSLWGIFRPRSAQCKANLRKQAHLQGTPVWQVKRKNKVTSQDISRVKWFLHLHRRASDLRQHTIDPTRGKAKEEARTFLTKVLSQVQATFSRIFFSTFRYVTIVLHVPFICATCWMSLIRVAPQGAEKGGVNWWPFCQWWCRL